MYYHKFTSQNGTPVRVLDGTIVAFFSSDKLKNKKDQNCSVLSLTNGKEITISEQICYIERQMSGGIFGFTQESDEAA